MGQTVKRSPIERRTALARGTTRLRRFTRLRNRSRRRARVSAERRDFVERVLKKRPICEVGAKLYGSYRLGEPRLCRTFAVDVHEIKTRARGGPIVPSQGLDERDVLTACRHCHDWVTEHPAQAAELGFVVHSWESRPSQA